VSALDLGKGVKITVSGRLNAATGSTVSVTATAAASGDFSPSNNSATVDLTVGNAAPSLAAIADQIADEGSLLDVVMTGSDPDLPAQSLTYSLVGAPEGASILPSIGIIGWTPSEAQGGS
jgi:hypothetical protein